MASILRTGKFLRYFAGFTRNVVVNSVRETDSGGNSLLQNTSAMCGGSIQKCGFANGGVPSPKSADLGLERQLRRLDNDVRRIGRISRRDLEDVLEEIRTQRSATSSQSLLVIRCCGNLVPEEMPEVRTALVQEIWKTLNALNVPMDISHYNALLRVYLENDHPFSPTDFLSEIESKSIEPNRVTYQRLIARYCQQGDIEGATRILEFMREKNLPVNENVFNSLIVGHSQANDMESAKGIIAVMKQAGLEASADTYTTLLCCYGRHGDIDAIRNTLAECEKKDVLLLDKDILDVIYSLAVNGHGDKVDDVLSKLRIMSGFNQDAVNIILRLINNGNEDVGFKILRLMPRGVRPDGQPTDVGSFFIKQLVKANRPVEKILSFCKILQEEGLNTKALLIATEAGLDHGIVNNALPLLKEMKNAGLPIRQHYFWPLICSAGADQVMDIVRRMQEEFSLFPNSETIREYIIPNLKEKNLEKIVTMLRDIGISSATAASATAYAALTSNQIKQAANIMESYRAYHMPQLFKTPLILALSKTNDYGSFVRIIRQIHDGVLQRRANNNEQKAATTKPTEEQDANEAEASLEPTETNNSNANDVVGNILWDTIAYFRSNRNAVLEKLLPALIQQGLSISSGMATRISERLGSEMTSKISEMLGKLSSGELEPVPLANSNARKRGIESLTIDELERFIANVEAKGESANNLKRHLLQACYRTKSVEKTLKVIERLESEKFVIPTGAWAQLIDLYVHHANSTEALALYEKIKKSDDAFVLDNFKTINVVNLLVQEERFDDAINFLERNKKPAVETENSFNYVTSIWRILNGIAEKGDEQQLRRLFDAIISGNYLVPTNITLGPLIKVHLIKDNIEKAMETFEKICETYKCTPWKNELACRLIQREDATNLQKLTDLSTNIHGEVNSLYDLVFSFVECGRIRQARKILETPGMRTRPNRIETACERYKNEGLVEPLEGLVEATKDLHHIDRNKIYYSLLLSYSKANDVEKALGLWTKMQEESVTPSDAFLNKLAELLKSNSMAVPFVLPQEANKKSTVNDAANAPVVSDKKKSTTASKPVIKPAVAAAASTTIQLFRKAIRAGDVDTAVSYQNKLSANEVPSVSDISHLIELLVRADRVSEASKYVDALMAEKRYPMPKIFKFYLNKIAAAGDVDGMLRIGAQIDGELKKLLSFDNRFCHANIVAGKVDQYLQMLHNDISGAKTPEDAAQLAAKFPRGGAIGILEKHPDKCGEFEKIAEKYAALNQLGPINVLWMHLVSNGDEVKSKAIWDKYLSNAPRLMFQRVLQTAREQKDAKLATAVVSHVRQSKISEGAIGNAYSCVIDIYNNEGNFEKSLETLKTAVKDICLENINRTALMRLKTGLEQQQKEFPFVIPEKQTKSNAHSSSSTSSISSDDDVTPPRPETKPTKPTSSSGSAA